MFFLVKIFSADKKIILRLINYNKKRSEFYFKMPIFMVEYDSYLEI